MERVLSTAIAALAVGILSSAAHSADINGGSKDGSTPGIFDAPRGSDFVGLGVGVHGGGQFTNIAIADEFDGIGADGLVAGLHAEYLFAIGRLRVGPYVDGSFSTVNVQFADLDAINQDYAFGGGVKAGITAFGSSLIFAKAGYEWSQWTSDIFDGNVDVGSLVLGGGIETMVASNVSLGLQADYLVPLSIEADGEDITDFLEETESLRVLLRLTYRQ